MKISSKNIYILIVILFLSYLMYPKTVQKKINKVECTKVKIKFMLARLTEYACMNQLHEKSFFLETQDFQSLKKWHIDHCSSNENFPLDEYDMKDCWGQYFFIKIRNDMNKYIKVWSSGENKKNENGKGDDVGFSGNDGFVTPALFLIKNCDENGAVNERKGHPKAAIKAD